jgi:RNA polymerase sigma-70 factor (ECF subfamily)
MFREFAPYVGRIALRLLGREDEVDDLVQEVFLVAWRSADSIRDPVATRAWLATITVRKARARLRTRRFWSMLGRDEAVDYEAIAGPEAGPDQRALLAEVYAILDRLPTNQRMAWTLRVVEGEKLDAVAVMCGCSLATAKRWILDAHETIKREVGDG